VRIATRTAEPQVKKLDQAFVRCRFVALNEAEAGRQRILLRQRARTTKPTARIITTPLEQDAFRRV
jgi:hypothetical protein